MESSSRSVLTKVECYIFLSLNFSSSFSFSPALYNVLLLLLLLPLRLYCSSSLLFIFFVHKKVSLFGGGGAERRSDQETRSLLATYDYGYGTMILDGVEHVIAQYSTCSCPMQPAMNMLESLNTALYSCGKKFLAYFAR